MDKNDSAVAEVPTFKVARVGQDRKRRRGGILSFFRKGPAPKSGWMGATGGSGGYSGITASSAGVINSAGASFSKVMLSLFVTATLGSGAVYMGASAGSRPKVEQKKSFVEKAPVKIEGDTSNLPTTSHSIPNSLGYLSNKEPAADKARREAEEAARVAAEEEAARKAAEEEAAAAAAAAQAPAEQQAAAPVPGGANFAKKYGSLSTGSGSASLSGGGGLSGGINRTFGGATGFSGGKGGQLSANRVAAKPTMTKAGRQSLAKSNVKGFARSQLVNANSLSRRGAGANRAETASYDAASAFDNNQGAGTVITGAGVGTGTRPQTVADNSVGTTESVGGGAIGGAECGDGQYPDPNGSGCLDIKDGNAESANKTLDNLAMVAQAMLAAISIMSVIAGAASATGYGATVAAGLLKVMGAMGAIIAVLGVAIIAMGDWAQGTVFTLTGAFITASALSWNFKTLTYTRALIASAAGMILGAAAKYLDAK